MRLKADIISLVKKLSGNYMSQIITSGGYNEVFFTEPNGFTDNICSKEKKDNPAGTC